MYSATVVIRGIGTNPAIESVVIPGFSTADAAIAAGTKVVEARKMNVNTSGVASFSTVPDHVVGKTFECYVTAVEVV